jgi:hypothetical protein
MSYKPTGRPRGRPRKQPEVITPQVVSISREKSDLNPVIPTATSKPVDVEKQRNEELEAAVTERGSELTRILSDLATSKNKLAPQYPVEVLVKFLSMLADGAFSKDIADATGISWADISRLSRHFPVFRELRKMATECGQKARYLALEEATLSRAYIGVEKPVYQGGQLVGHTREFANDLAKLHLQAFAPKKYGNPGGGGSSQVNISGQNVGIVVQWAIPD